jgi:hypothetical protein
MDRLDIIYQNAVTQEIDRLARLSPCDLMQLEPRSWKVETELVPIELTCKIFDGGDQRLIAILAERPVMLGLAARKFADALEVKLSCERLSSLQVADFYD